MSVYVDVLRDFGWKIRGRRVRNAHLIADSLEELHELASRIGLRREWFQPKSFPHYDLTPKRRERAIAAGAIALERDAFIRTLQRIREENRG